VSKYGGHKDLHIWTSKRKESFLGFLRNPKDASFRFEVSKQELLRSLAKTLDALRRRVAVIDHSTVLGY